MIKRLLQILIIALPTISFGQSSDNKRVYLGVTKKVPVQNAKVYYEEYYGTRLYSSFDGLNFEPIDDSVFSISSSVVCAVFDLGNGQTIVTKDSLNRFYVYTNLREVYFAKNDAIKRRSLIGLINHEYQISNGYFLMITDNKGRYLSAEKIWQLIKDDSCTSVQVSDTTMSP